MHIASCSYLFIAIKGCNCTTTLISYLMVTSKHGVVILKESEDQQ